VRTAQPHNATTVYRRRPGLGLGQLLSLGRRDESPDLRRCPRGHACGSSGRLVQGAQAAACPQDGTAGPTSGQAALPWACSEAAGLCCRDHPAGQDALTRVEPLHGQGQAFIPAHQVARAVDDRCTRATTCGRCTVVAEGARGGGEPIAALDQHGLGLGSALCDGYLTALTNA
jgi:hypothetical protein